MTLFTDAILLGNERNQWYVQNTVHESNIEITLNALMKALSKYNSRVSKSFINYSLAPMINRAIRVGASNEALAVVLKYPEYINELSKYKSNQDIAISNGVGMAVDHGSYYTLDITNTNISKSYCGVIAGRLCNGIKNAIAYRVDNGIAKGSFRGRDSKADYRRQFEIYDKSIKALGHAQAFGFELPIQTIKNTFRRLSAKYRKNIPFIWSEISPKIC